MIDYNKKLIFFHPSKTGGTSIKRAICFGDQKPIHYNDKKKYEYDLTGRQQIGHKSLNQFFFRPKSQSQTIIQQFKDKQFTVFGSVRNPYCRAASIVAVKKVSTKEKYSNIIDIVNGASNDWDVQKVHINFIRPQTQVISDLCDFLVRICDGQSQNLDRAQKLIGSNIVHSNKSHRKHVLSEEQRAFVREYYKLDFQKLGYQM